MPIQDYIAEPLAWTQPHMLTSDYELRHGQELIGSLRFRSSWGSLATAEVDGGCWTFKRLGFFHTRVSIRACNSETDLGIFRNNTWSGGGTLELPDERRFPANTNFWHSRYEFVAPDGTPLILYRTKKGFRLNGEMEMLPSVKAMKEAPWLAMLGWYLAVMMYRDDSAAAAVAITAG